MEYRTTILEADGTQSTAVIDAPDEQALYERLHGQGKTLLRAKAQTGRSASVAATHGVHSTKLPAARLLAFTQSMEGALDAGVPVLQALDAIIEQEEDPRVAEMFGDISRQVSGGKSFSEALQSFPRSFPPVYSAMVHAGESSGQMPAVLASIASWQEWRIDVSATIRQAMIYPAVVIGAGYALVLFMLAFVIPSLADVLVKIGGDLPLASRLLFDTSTFVSQNVIAILGATLAGIVGLVLFAKSDTGASTLLSGMSILPVTKNVITTISVAKFCRNLSVLLSAGLTVTRALELSREAVGMHSTRDAIERATSEIVSGHKLTDSLARTKFLPPIAISMIRVGEESGRLPNSFERLNRVYEREVKATVKRALSLLEPTVTVILGVVVGGIAALVVSTIYTAMQGIGR